MPDDYDFSTTMRIDIAPDLDGETPKSVSIRPDKEQKPRAVKGVRKTDVKSPIIGSPDFRELFQNVYDAALITTLDGGIITANERAIHRLQYKLKDLAGLNILNLISGASRTLVETICDTLENDRFVLIQAFCCRRDETLFPAEISVNRLQLSGTGYLNFFIRDVTVRKEAEDRLRTGHTAIQNSGNGIAVADLDAELEYCNRAMIELLGAKTKSAITGQHLGTFLTDDVKRDAILKAVLKERTWGGELEMRRLDGSRFFAQASVAPNVDSDGELIGMVVSLLDISDQKRIQQELQERNTQMEEDLKLAREFQQAFIRRDCPVFPHGTDPEGSVLQFGHAYLPSGAVGGDFFDVLAVSDKEAGIFISDVMGHGVRSALVVATIRGLVEELASLAHDPGAFLTQINRDLSKIMKHSGQLTFVTALYLVIDLSTGETRYASAGHPNPYHLHANTGEAELIPFDKGSRGPALALFENAVYDSGRCDLEEGDLLLLYTDGVCEAENENGEPYDENRMPTALEKNRLLPPPSIVEALIDDLEGFCGHTEFDDDVCLVSAGLRELLD